MAFVYPPNQTDNGAALLSIIGSFWTDLYDGVDFIAAYTKALGILSYQTHNDIKELSDTLSRHLVPVFHSRNWYAINLLKSDLQQGSIQVFGEGNVFGPQPASGIVYDFGNIIDTSVTFDTAVELQEAAIICNRINDPSVVLINNIDFGLLPGLSKIGFRENPFNNPLIPQVNLFDNLGNVTDKQITLWVYNAKIDWKHIYTHYGYALGINLPSSYNYKNFVNNVLDGVVGASSLQVIKSALATIADCPLTKTDNETVQYIQNDGNFKLIITDKNVYKFNKTSIALVSIGDVVNTGDELVDTVRVFTFRDGNVPSNSVLPQIVVPTSYLQIASSGSLTFVNSQQAATVTTVSSYTKITFPITGDGGDVTLFWDTVHTNGIANGTTLANLLDTRTIKTGQPVAANLPVTINPMQFLASNVFRNNLILVVIKTSQFGNNTLGVSTLQYLKQIVPSRIALLINEI